MNVPKRQRRNKSYRGCTHCRESRKKCSEERPCSYCVKTGHAESCEYNGLETLIRFDKKSIACVKSTASRRKPSKKEVCNVLDFSTDVSTDFLTNLSAGITPTSIPSTPNTSSSYSSNNSTPPSIPKWFLSNGTGFETRDIPYIHYFMDRFPTDRWFAQIAQPIAVYMITNAMNAPVLHHATLAVAALLASRDPYDQPQPAKVCLQRYLEHKQKALQMVRYHLEWEDIGGPLAVAIAFLLITEKGNPDTRRVHMHGLKSVLQHLQAQLFEEENTALPPTLAPLYWLSWSMGIGFDIGQATIEGDPILDPLPFTADYEARNRSWIQQMCGLSINNEGVEFSILFCTLRMFLHRAFHLAAMARKYRASPSYSPVHEAKIQRLCCQLERDLEDWMSRHLSLHAPAFFHSRPYDNTTSFLDYPPIPMHKTHSQNVMIEYHMAKLYVSFISIPEIGPGPPESRRFEHALEICRSLVGMQTDRRWSHLAQYTRLFQLFLCCLAFGGMDCFAVESEAAVKLIKASASQDWGFTVEEVFYRWAQHCPGLPPISPDMFPWLSDCGNKTAIVAIQ